MAPVILLVDDDKSIVELVKYNLEREGYLVHVALDGEEAVQKARQLHPALVVLDIMLPKRDGLSVCRVLRQEVDTAILMISARYESSDKIEGLESGADDYLAKPFSVRELVARVKALLRRNARQAAPPEREACLRVGRVVLNQSHHEVTVDNVPVTLSYKEFALLAALMANTGRVMTRDLLLGRIWGYSGFPGSRTLDVHLSHLRRKIEPAGECRIETVKGLGYKLVQTSSRADRGGAMA